MIADRLGHARCVIAVWSRHSIGNRWVLDEAERAANRGVLVTARLDEVDPPLGFGGYTYADLVDWTGGRNTQLDKMLRHVAGVNRKRS